MKRFTQFVCLILVLSLTLAVPVSATEVMPRASDYFMSHSCYLWEISDTEFQVWFQVAAVKGMDELGVSLIEVEKSSDRVNWEVVQSYAKANYSQMICTNTAGHTGYVTFYNAEPGYYYRAYVKFYAKLGNGTAEYPIYTSSI